MLQSACAVCAACVNALGLAAGVRAVHDGWTAGLEQHVSSGSQPVMHVSKPVEPPALGNQNLPVPLVEAVFPSCSSVHMKHAPSTITILADCTSWASPPRHFWRKPCPVSRTTCLFQFQILFTIRMPTITQIPLRYSRPSHCSCAQNIHDTSVCLVPTI